MQHKHKRAPYASKPVGAPSFKNPNVAYNLYLLLARITDEWDDEIGQYQKLCVTLLALFTERKLSKKMDNLWPDSGMGVMLMALQEFFTAISKPECLAELKQIVDSITREEAELLRLHGYVPPIQLTTNN